MMTTKPKPAGTILPRFKAEVVGHNWRGDTNLCIGGVGYNADSFLCLVCSEEELEQFPVGTTFELVVSEPGKARDLEAEAQALERERQACKRLVDAMARRRMGK